MGQRTNHLTSRKQARTLGILLVVLCVIVFSPSIRLGVQDVLRRDPVRLGTAEISIPKTWMVSESPRRITAWKPCSTIFCISLRPTIVFETKDMSDDIWTKAALKVFQDNYSPNVTTQTLDTDSGQVKCVEGLNSTLGDARLVASCINSNLRLAFTYTGDATTKPVFYAILTKAHRATRSL
jgi:hypothetical protein